MKYCNRNAQSGELSPERRRFLPFRWRRQRKRKKEQHNIPDFIGVPQQQLHPLFRENMFIQKRNVDMKALHQIVIGIIQLYQQQEKPYANGPKYDIRIYLIILFLNLR